MSMLQPLNEVYHRALAVTAGILEHHELVSLTREEMGELITAFANSTHPDAAVREQAAKIQEDLVTKAQMHGAHFDAMCMGFAGG